jgi:hypothetical protein
MQLASAEGVYLYQYKHSQWVFGSIKLSIKLSTNVGKELPNVSAMGTESLMQITSLQE